jgi:hypothetical protein|tara:strand:+ start:214 stop:594 length:381 start_codon:yes stop_codon:yes gene_type:complete
MKDIFRLPTPTRPSVERLKEIEKEHQEALQKIYDRCDDRIVHATLHYFKGTTQVLKQVHYLTGANGRSIYSSDDDRCYNSCIMVGTELQMAKDKSVYNITGSYSYNLTEEMLKMYEDNDRQLIIIK